MQGTDRMRHGIFIVLSGGGNQQATGAGGGKFVMSMPCPVISDVQHHNIMHLYGSQFHDCGGNATLFER